MKDLPAQAGQPGLTSWPTRSARCALGWYKSSFTKARLFKSSELKKFASINPAAHWTPRGKHEFLAAPTPPGEACESKPKPIMHSKNGLLLAVVANITLAGASALAQPAGNEIESLKKQIQDLDQKVRVLERNKELENEAAETKRIDAPRLTAGQDGFSF